MNSELLNEMIAVTRKDLENVNKYGAKVIMKDAAKKIIGKKPSNHDMLFWPAGMLLLGLSSVCNLDCLDDSLKEEIVRDLRSYMDTWAEITEETFEYVDDALAGVSVLNLFSMTGDFKYMKYAGKLNEFLQKYKHTSEGSIVYNQSAGNDYVFADGAGETSMFFFRYAAATKSAVSFISGAMQLGAFYANGFDNISYLPYHAFSGESHEKLGLLGWGRSFGWLLMGYSEGISHINDLDSDKGANPELEKAITDVLAQYLSICKTAIAYQRPDGGFSWHLPAIEGKPDTSATAMIGYAISRGLKAGVFGRDTKVYEETVHRILEFLQKHTTNGSVGHSLCGCEDLAVHRQIYGHFPWGQGAALAFVGEMR